MKTFIIIGLVIIILLLWSENSKLKNQKYINKQNMIKKLIRQASRWSTASTQDKNAMIAVLHANYGSGYLWSLFDLFTRDEITRVTGIDTFKFEEEITNAQDLATKKMANLCPEYAPTPSYLTKIAGEG